MVKPLCNSREIVTGFTVHPRHTPCHLDSKTQWCDPLTVAFSTRPSHSAEAVRQHLKRLHYVTCDVNTTTYLACDSHIAPAALLCCPIAEAVRRDLKLLQSRTAVVSSRQVCVACNRCILDPPPNPLKLPSGGAVPPFYLFPTGQAFHVLCAAAEVVQYGGDKREKEVRETQWLAYQRSVQC
jgi:hypothetical protein